MALRIVERVVVVVVVERRSFSVVVRSCRNVSVVFGAFRLVGLDAVRSPDGDHHVLRDTCGFLPYAVVVQRFAVRGVEQDSLAS